MCAHDVEGRISKKIFTNDELLGGRAAERTAEPFE
jgi:hypothetical protein